MSTEDRCDCDYWHSKHRWHCATNYESTPTPAAPSRRAEVNGEGRG